MPARNNGAILAIPQTTAFDDNCDFVISIHDQINNPAKFVGLGETPGDTKPIDPEIFVEAMFSQQAE